jgi:hypothetical protein
LLACSVVCWRHELEFTGILLLMEYAVFVILIATGIFRDLLVV